MKFAGTESQIEVDETTTRACPAFVFRSYTLGEVLLYMNAHSSNFVAERLGDLVGGPEGIARFLVEELKLPAEQVRLATASGRQSNAMTPRGILAVIRALDGEAQRQGLKLEDIMPVITNDYGTLHGRLRDTPLGGAGVGKTGTLPIQYDGGMASLGGIIYTSQNGPVVFAVLDRGGNIWENRQLEDQLLAEVLTTFDSTVPVPVQTPRQILPPSGLRIEPETAGSVPPAAGSERKEAGSRQPAAGTKQKAEGAKQKVEGSKQKAVGSKQKAVGISGRHQKKISN